MKILTARSMSQLGFTPFTVSGGIFSGDVLMGWQVTDGRGHTLAVACDPAFVESINALTGLALLLERIDAYYLLRKARDHGRVDCSDDEWLGIRKGFLAIREMANE